MERLSQGRPCRGPARGCEGNWLFSYHSRHSTHILFLLQGPVSLMHTSRESSSSQPHIVFSFVLNINWIPEGCITPCYSVHNAASQEGNTGRLLSRGLLCFIRGCIARCHVTSCLHFIHLQRTGQSSQKCIHFSGISSSAFLRRDCTNVFIIHQPSN